MNNASHPLVSIIVPVYNVKRYLEQCVKSIVEQSYKNIELILVDDGSDDGSSELCDLIRSKYPNTKVFHKTNSGVSSARNIGLDISRGEYIVFIDSDDTISQNYIEDFINSSKDTDIVIGGIEDVYIDGNNHIYKRVLRQHKAPYEGWVSKEYYQLLNWLRGPCAKLYKKSIIDLYNIRFKENLSVAEDQVFNFQYYKHIKTYKIVLDSIYTYYHYNQDSSLSVMLNEKSFSDDIFKLNLEYKFLSEYCSIDFYNIYIHELAGLFRKYRILKDDSSLISNYNRVKKLAEINNVAFDKRLSFKNRIIVILLMFKLYWIIVMYYRLKSYN